MKFRLDGRGGRFARSSATRAADQAETLLAAADSLAANYEITQGSLPGRLFYARALEVGYREIGGSEWPYEGELAEIEDALIRDDRGVVFELPDGTLAWISSGYGWFHATVAAPTREAVQSTFAAFAAQYPALYREAVDDQTVPITFWTDSRHGPVSRLRIIDASPWTEIERNYSSEVRDELGALMSDFEPGKSGQLLLWQGPPGTGKSWALRALASEWRSWAEFNYITDPDAFFVTNPSYLIDVLLHESYEELVVLEEEGDAEVVSTDKLGKWRVLILEDTGELLAANAKESYGQGLSRLLNVVDGLVGQGLRVLVLVTTNDELGELHPAVKRPGRCASQIEFGPLSAEDASAWLGESTEEGGTLAELYARRGEGKEALATVDLDALAQVAEEHAPEGGYGETAWNAGTSTVFWVSADWSSNEEVDAAETAFRAVPGVENFDYEAEAALPEGDGWETVWPSTQASAAPEVDEPEETPVERWDRLARELESEIEEDGEPIIASGTSREEFLSGVLRLAAEEVDQGRRREAAQFSSRTREDRGVIREVLAAMREMATRKPGDTHITMPATELHPHVTIHEPPITIEPAPAPDVSVNVEPAQITVEAAPTPNVEVRPEIHVQQPNVEVALPEVRVAAPDVHVTVEQPRASSVRAIKEDDGSTVFTVEEPEEEESE